MLKKKITFQQYKGLFSQVRSFKNLLPELGTSYRLGRADIPNGNTLCLWLSSTNRRVDKTLKVKMGKLKRKEGKIEHLTAPFYRRFFLRNAVFFTGLRR